eukprot:evm.model.NODE_28852_length_12777_cov_25.675354.6
MGVVRPCILRRRLSGFGEAGNRHSYASEIPTVIGTGRGKGCGVQVQGAKRCPHPPRPRRQNFKSNDAEVRFSEKFSLDLDLLSHSKSPNTGRGMGSPPPLPQHELNAYDHGSAQFDEILQSIPPVDFCFAYGSGVFDQHGYHDDDDHHHSTVAHKQATTSRGNQIILPTSPSRCVRDPARLPMLDLVLAVRNPIEWHRENLARNWRHYSLLRYLGAERLGQIGGEQDVCLEFER